VKELEDAIYARASGDGTLGALLRATTAVYPYKAPPGALPDYVIFYQNGYSNDEYTFAARAIEWVTFVIKGVSGPTTDDSNAEAIAARIDVLFTDNPLSVSGNTFLYGRRTSRLKYPEYAAGGDQYFHVGGMYRFGLDPA
jgi:hypothetical protein